MPFNSDCAWRGLVGVFGSLLFSAGMATASDCTKPLHRLPVKIQAEDFCQQIDTGGLKKDVGQERTYIDALRKGDELRYAIAASEQPLLLSLHYASRKGGAVQITAGQVNREISLAKTKSDTDYVTVTIALNLDRGVQQLSLTGLEGSVQVDWLSFVNDYQQAQSLLAPGVYALINENSRQSLDVQDRSTVSGGNIQQWDYHASANQSWRLVDLGANQYQIVNQLSGLCLAEQPESANLMQMSCVVQSRQLWSFELIADNRYVIRNNASSSVISVLENAEFNGANVWLAPFEQQRSQLWRVNIFR